jgi:hypothetical protein
LVECIGLALVIKSDRAIPRNDEAGVDFSGRDYRAPPMIIEPGQLHPLFGRKRELV